MSVILAVFRKEMVDHLRDRRSILAAMLYPLIGPVLLGVLFVFIGSGMRAVEQAPLIVPVVNPDSAPDLVRHLEQHGMVVRRLAGDPVGFVAAGRSAFAVVLPEGPPSDGQSPLPIRLISNPSRFDSIAAIGQIIERLNEYERDAVRERLDAAGLSPNMLSVIKLSHESIGRVMGPAVIVLAMIPPFLIFTLFTGGVHVVLDSLIGERERGSFEALMMNPVSRNQVLTGKLGAAIVFTLMALGVQVVAFGLVLNLLPREALGPVTPPDLPKLAFLVSICLPVAVFAASAQLLISSMTRSVKEAQTYLGLLPLFPGLGSIVLALAPVGAKPLVAAIPSFGQSVLMGQIVRGDPIGAAPVVIAAIATLAAAALLLAIGLRLFEREGILFPR